MSIAVLDVHYCAHGARAACVLAASWQAEAPAASFVAELAAVAAYEPGAFYRRELPCLLAVLERVPATPEAIVIDGYVWLPGQQPGLGAHLYDALGRATPVLGIAKSAYAGAQNSPAIAPVLRGASMRPLFVSAAGMALALAAERVAAMAGRHRVPELVRAADRLARGLAAEAGQR